jgi:hypothetical protein
VAKHTRFVSIPELKQIGMPDAREGAFGAGLAFLSLNGYLLAPERE